MARLLTCGYETGSIAEDGGTGYSNGSGSAAPAVVTGTPSPRSGTYCAKFNSGTVAATTSCSYRLITLAGNPQEVYLRFAFYYAVGSANATYVLLRINDNAGTTHLNLRWNPQTTLLTLHSGATTTLLATASDTIPGAEWNGLEIRVKIAESPDGVFQLWQNNVLVIDYSGDTAASANLDVGQIQIGMRNETAGASGGYAAIDDLGINDTTDPGGGQQMGRLYDAAVLYLAPSGNGTTSQLTGSDSNQVDNYALVDEIPPATADYVQSSTADQYDTYALANVPGGYDTVVLVQPVRLCRAGLGGHRGAPSRASLGRHRLRRCRRHEPDHDVCVRQGRRALRRSR